MFHSSSHLNFFSEASIHSEVDGDSELPISNVAVRSISSGVHLVHFYPSQYFLHVGYCCLTSTTFRGSVSWLRHGIAQLTRLKCHMFENTKQVGIDSSYRAAAHVTRFHNLLNTAQREAQKRGKATFKAPHWLLIIILREIFGKYIYNA